ncbi:pyocin activator PrtN family protein [Pseudomonas otitidis]|uniref:pyocin activator PrtN family protein n=1 Tax=Metapseudomonas otitidis TaxID=319939 RepID=UPI00244C132E|nr:pyocin activator PrtN family protein [Pseudomonas otitidis]MDH1107317.1 pyocin activator PrtN family protein [Pseudomonas otitidis]MDH1158963.1 pyocin activator PrtN family protein [Pseudomonas otitidis]MDH1163339.1 pyocin activator PrtN family protein [Pseudomonas otitidis]
MKTTLDQLLVQWKATSLPLATVREHYFPHIKTDKHLRKLITSGKVNLPTYKHSPSRLAKPWVRLQDLANWLDAQSSQVA